MRLLLQDLTKKGRIIGGHWTSVVVNGSLVFAVSNDPAQVYVLQYLNLKWSKVRSFKTNGTPGKISTIAISNDNIVSCSSETNDYYFYSIQGKLQVVFDGPGGDNVGKAETDAHYPYLCGGDAAGSLLIAEQQEYGLQVLSKDGKFRSLKLQPDVKMPRRAVLHKKTLFVVDMLDNKLFKYI